MDYTQICAIIALIRWCARMLTSAYGCCLDRSCVFQDCSISFSFPERHRHGQMDVCAWCTYTRCARASRGFQNWHEKNAILIRQSAWIRRRRIEGKITRAYHILYVAYSSTFVVRAYQFSLNLWKWLGNANKWKYNKSMSFNPLASRWQVHILRLFVGWMWHYSGVLFPRTLTHRTNRTYTRIGNEQRFWPAATLKIYRLNLQYYKTMMSNEWQFAFALILLRFGRSLLCLSCRLVIRFNFLSVYLFYLFTYIRRYGAVLVFAFIFITTFAASNAEYISVLLLCLCYFEMRSCLYTLLSISFHFRWIFGCHFLHVFRCIGVIPIRSDWIRKRLKQPTVNQTFLPFNCCSCKCFTKTESSRCVALFPTKI